MQTVCVFCSSSNDLKNAYQTGAIELGKALGEKKYAVAYGGTNVGLMGIIASTAQQHGSRVIGVVPQKLEDMGITNLEADEIHICKGLRERKGIMDGISDAFIALPGGMGTFEELIEVINLKFLGYHQKPIILLNIDNFFEPFLALMRHLFEERFTRKEVMQLIYIANTIDDCINCLQSSPSQTSIEPKYKSK